MGLDEKEGISFARALEMSYEVVGGGMERCRGVRVVEER
jgi:hypothetical protein